MNRIVLDPDETQQHRPPLYGAFYGLREAPFDHTPNPRFLFLTARQREPLGNLRSAMSSATGVTLVLGEAGTGKSTLVRTALAELGDTASRYALVTNPTLSPAEFHEHLARDFSLSTQAATSKAPFLTELKAAASDRAAAGGVTGLIVDDAHHLRQELIEEIQLLANIETATTTLLNVVLCGQPELIDRLNEASLRQLKRRVALRCKLRPFRLDETASYISTRVRVAGGTPNLVFGPRAVMAVHEGSAGIPRTINVICDNALIRGCAARLKPVPAGIIEEVLRDFDLSGTAAVGEVAPFDRPIGSDSHDGTGLPSRPAAGNEASVATFHRRPAPVHPPEEPPEPPAPASSTPKERPLFSTRRDPPKRRS